MLPLNSSTFLITISAIICVTVPLVSSASIRSETAPAIKDGDTLSTSVIGQVEISASVQNHDHAHDHNHDHNHDHAHDHHDHDHDHNHDHNHDHYDEHHFDDGHTHAPVVKEDQDVKNEMTTPSSDDQSATDGVTEMSEDEMKKGLDTGKEIIDKAVPETAAVETLNRKKRQWWWNSWNDSYDHDYHHHVEYHRPYCHGNHCHRGHYHHYYHK